MHMLFISFFHYINCYTLPPLIERSGRRRYHGTHSWYAISEQIHNAGTCYLVQKHVHIHVFFNQSGTGVIVVHLAKLPLHTCILRWCA